MGIVLARCPALRTAVELAKDRPGHELALARSPWLRVREGRRPGGVADMMFPRRGHIPHHRNAAVRYLIRNRVQALGQLKPPNYKRKPVYLARCLDRICRY